MVGVEIWDDSSLAVLIVANADQLRRGPGAFTPGPFYIHGQPRYKHKGYG